MPERRGQAMRAPLAIRVGAAPRLQPSHELGGVVSGLVDHFVLRVLLELKQRRVLVVSVALARAAAGQ